jgi:hypothetical protein
MLLVIKDFDSTWRHALAKVRNASMQGVGTKMGTAAWAAIQGSVVVPAIVSRRYY